MTEIEKNHRQDESVELALPKVIYVGNPEVIKAINPEFPFAIKINESKVAEILREKGISEKLIKKFKIIVDYGNSPLPRVARSLTGGNIAGIAHPFNETIKIYVSALNFAAKKELEKIDTELGIKKLTKAELIRDKYLYKFMSWYLFTDAMVNKKSIYSGNKERREKYLKLAAEKPELAQRAHEFMANDISNIFKGRQIQETLEHETHHALNKTDIYKAIITVLGINFGAWILSNFIGIEPKPVVERTDIEKILAILAVIALIPCVNLLRGAFVEDNAYDAGRVREASDKWNQAIEFIPLPDR
jgi:hypothetical protein